jgi:hypothetical protein
VLFESDKCIVISLINSEGSNPRNYVGNVVWGINCNKRLFRSCGFRHINRDANRVAYSLALLAHDEPNKVWLEEVPPQLVTTLLTFKGLDPLINFVFTNKTKKLMKISRRQNRIELVIQIKQ